MPYAEILLEHFWKPKNNRVMRDATAIGVAGVPGNGPFLVLYLRLDGDTITEAAFQTHGCPPSIAAGSLLCASLPGSTTAAAVERWTDPAIDGALGGLPVHKRHCSALAAEALKRAVSNRPLTERATDTSPRPGA